MTSAYFSNVGLYARSEWIAAADHSSQNITTDGSCDRTYEVFQGQESPQWLL